MSQTPVDFSGDPSGDELLDDLLTPEQENFLTGHSGTSRPSYAQAGTEWIDTTSNPWIVKRFDGTDDIIVGYINTSTNTYTPAGLILDKVDATTAPTINDDDADGYSVGSKWVDVTNDRGYLCVDASTGAAVWKEITGSITGPGSSVDNEIILFSGTSGRVIKRATGTGYVKVSSGVMQTPAATIPLTDLANQAAQSILINATGLSAPPTAVTVASNKLVGRGSGNVGEITLGTRLSMSGSTLNVDNNTNDRQIFTSSGTWTKPSGFDSSSMVLIECWGGGGGSNVSGGGGGSYKSRFIPLSSLGSTETVTVGAGGSGYSGSGNGTPGSGGNSSFGSHITAYGGSGGPNTGGFGGAGGGFASNTPNSVTNDTGGQGYGANNVTVATPGYETGGGGGYNGGSSGKILGALSVYGGGGGSGANGNNPGGTSQFGGNGGAGVTSGTGGSPTAPGGGGGGGQSGGDSRGVDGARGEVRVTVFG